MPDCEKCCGGGYIKQRSVLCDCSAGIAARKQIKKVIDWLEEDPDLIACMPIEDVRKELAAAGIDTKPLIRQIRARLKAP